VSCLEELPLSADHVTAVRKALQGRSSTKSHTEFGRLLDASLDGSPRELFPTAVPIHELSPKRFGNGKRE
jgi:hypothetical protein